MLMIMKGPQLCKAIHKIGLLTLHPQVDREVELDLRMEKIHRQEKEDLHLPVQEVRKQKSKLEEHKLIRQANKTLFILKLKILKEVGLKKRKDILELLVKANILSIIQ